MGSTPPCFVMLLALRFLLTVLSAEILNFFEVICNDRCKWRFELMQISECHLKIYFREQICAMRTVIVDTSNKLYLIDFAVTMRYE